MLEDYAGGRHKRPPVGSYALLIATYTGLFGGALRLAARRGLLPNRIPAADVFLLGVATHRVSRILTRDRIATPLRMPFTQLEGPAGAGEVSEKPRGRGLQEAVGSLLTCPFCAGPWIAAVLTTALIARPRETRAVVSTLSMVTVADFLHQLYAFARRASG